MTEGSPNDVTVGRHKITTLKGRADQSRTRAEKLADRMTESFGSTAFLVFNTIWFVVWIVWNTRIIPGLVPFDVFPFGMLTMVVSLEAIFLSVFVLIAQNRSAKIDQLRAEVDLQVDLIAEEELTKLLQIVSMLAEKQGIDLSQDEELRSMIAPTNLASIEKELQNEMTPRKGAPKPPPG
jgi:uncharacterized membrane protein